MEIIKRKVKKPVKDLPHNQYYAVMLTDDRGDDIKLERNTHGHIYISRSFVVMRKPSRGETVIVKPEADDRYFNI